MKYWYELFVSLTSSISLLVSHGTQSLGRTTLTKTSGVRIFDLDKKRTNRIYIHVFTIRHNLTYSI